MSRLRAQKPAGRRFRYRGCRIGPVSSVAAGARRTEEFWPAHRTTFVLAGSSEGFELVTQLRKEPFDIATFAGRTYVATMAGLLELSETGQTDCAADDVAPVLLVPTETVLFAFGIGPGATGAGEIAVWKGQPDGRLTETWRIRIRRAGSGA